MENNLKFKTNLDCGHCVARVKPFLDKLVGTDSWSVDTDNPDKVLTVTSANNITSEQIIDTVENVGFDIEKIG